MVNIDDEILYLNSFYALCHTDELIDSSLSVLSLEAGDSLPVHSTSTEKV